MWRRVANWYRKWEDEQIAVLERPELASQAAQGYRRFYYCKLAERSPLERQQLRDFSVALKGWRGWLWTAGLLALFNLCGLALHEFLPGRSWAAAIVTANLLGIALTFVLIAAWFNYRQFSRQKLKMLLAVLGFTVFAAVTSTALSMWMQGQPLAHAMERVSHFTGGVLSGSLAILAPVLLISILRNRHYEALNTQLQREAEQARLARELSESQLRLLRAQIEPHFLFNTLGAVQQLAQHGAPRAAELTANLIDFLRSSMRDMRSEQVPLSAEFGLVESYLKVMQARLGERLRFSLQLPRALEQVQLPSMILLTLVENAIKHGIEPALRGGEVTLSASVIEGAVRIRVQDGGVGMSTIPADDDGGGTGLDNVRHRLRLAYGDAASLVLRDGDPGLVADVTIPHAQA
jgi:LytS/YehU family sensor histidine kinase